MTPLLLGEAMLRGFLMGKSILGLIGARPREIVISNVIDPLANRIL